MGSGKKPSTAAKEEIHSILQRLKRYNHVGMNKAGVELLVQQPPNQAFYGMGRRLGVCMLEGDMEEQMGLDIIEVLLSNQTNLSVSSAFFQMLQEQSTLSQNKTIPRAWIVSWIVQASDIKGCHVLPSILRYFAWNCRQEATLHTLDEDIITKVYSILKDSTSRVQFTSFLAHQATSEIVRQLLSPIMAICVLSHSPTSDNYERTLILNVLFRTCWSLALTYDTISWLLESLQIYMIYKEEMLALHWLEQVMEMIIAIQDVHDEATREQQSTLMSMIFTHILPRFFLGGKAPYLQNLIQLSLQICQQCNSLNDETLLQLTNIILTTPHQVDRLGLLQVMDIVSGKSSSKWAFVLRRIMQSTISQDEYIFDIASSLRLESLDIQSDKKCVDTDFLFQIDPKDLSTFLISATKAIHETNASQVRSWNQNSLFLNAAALLISVDNDQALDFVASLLQLFPHLGIPFVPLLMNWIYDVIAKNQDGKRYLHRLRFLCESVASDAMCAQVVWSLVGSSLATPRDQPLSIRLGAIAMFPVLCENNRRLYRRVVDTLGIFVGERQTELRLAAVTTVCKMAELDLIRDVSDVIGWLQTFLTDDEPSIVHISILALHHLILNGELDFDLVIKVLGKRLCPLDDLENLMKMNPLVVEAIVILLGDGEICGDKSDDSEEKLSPQIQKSVHTLIDMSQSTMYREDRIRFRVLKSLSNYSLEALLVDEDAIKGLTGRKSNDEGENIPTVSYNYIALTNLVKENIMNPSFLGLHETNETKCPVEVLAKKIVRQEEDVLGTSLWQKGFKNLSDTKKKSKNVRISKSLLASLPRPDEIQEYYDDNPSIFSAIAALFCFDGNDFHKLGDLASEISNYSMSPLLKILNLQAWFHAMSRVWKALLKSDLDSIPTRVENIVTMIEGWSKINHKVDCTHLALLAFVLYIPNTIETTHTFVSLIQKIAKLAEEDYHRHQFTDLDIGHICLALAGVRMLHTGSSDTYVRVLHTLKSPADGNSGSLGTFFGLSLMASIVPNDYSKAQSTLLIDQKNFRVWAGQIFGFLMYELQCCLEGENPVIATFVASVSSLSSYPGILKEIRDLGELRIRATCQEKAMYLFMSLGASFHTLVGISKDLSLALFYLLQKLPFGSGVEYALASMIKNDVIAESVSSGDMDEWKAKVSQTFPTSDGLYLSASLTSESTGKAWLKSNISRFNSLNQALSLIPLIGSLPVFGFRDSSPISKMKLSAHVDKSLIEAVLKELNNVDDDVSIIIRGQLSSMSMIDENDEVDLMMTASSQIANKPRFSSQNTFKLPTPNECTLLFHLVSLISDELALIKEGNAGNTSVLCRIFGCLTTLSLPGQFAVNMIQPLLSRQTISNELGVAAINLLVSQFKERRKVAIDGRDFVRLGEHLLVTENETVSHAGVEILMNSLPELFRKSSSDTIDVIISKSYWKCEYAFETHGSLELMCKWLQVVEDMLLDIKDKNTFSLSPKIVNVLRNFIVDGAFAFMAKAIPIDESSLLFDRFIACLGNIPVTFLENVTFFSFEGDQDQKMLYWKARCVSCLIGIDFFESSERMKRVAMILFTWLSRQFSKGQDTISLQKMLFLIVSNVRLMDDALKHEILLKLFESMLVNGHETMSLDLIVLLVTADGGEQISFITSLVRGMRSLPSMSGKTFLQLWSSIMKDCPQNFGAFTKRCKGERVMSNRIIQVMNHWQAQGAPKDKLSMLYQMLVNCNNGDDSTEKDFIYYTTNKLMVRDSKKTFCD